jgi:hypothetical protein
MTEPHPCGHVTVERGCGGCDPAAVDYVIENGVKRASGGGVYIAPVGTPLPAGDPADDPNWKEI